MKVLENIVSDLEQRITDASLGLESFEDLGFNSEEELELEISKLTKFRPEFDTNLQ